jgi:N-acetyl-anhydromuramyl-L-alanine amidase AmpD
MVKLQPIFFRGLGQGLNDRATDGISLIVIHQTAGSTNVHGSLEWFLSKDKKTGLPVGSPHYIVSAEDRPHVVKVVKDKRVAGHAGGSLASWKGKPYADNFSIGIENSHAPGTPWPRAQIDRLIRLLEQLLRAYPSIPRNRIVGHQDVLSIHRDCPGMDFDWVLLEKEGLGMVPRNGNISLDQAYGGFFRHEPQGELKPGDQDKKRDWGGRGRGTDKRSPWVAGPVPVVVEVIVAIATGNGAATVSGAPIAELQKDLIDIGYSFLKVTGVYDALTTNAVEFFQKHFFAGSRKGLVKLKGPGKATVDRVTAEYIKRVRP